MGEHLEASSFFFDEYSPAILDVILLGTHVLFCASKRLH
jgi:hypothetical protein